MFVRAWNATGLTASVTPGARIAWIVIGVAAALVVGGYPLIEGFQTRGASVVLLMTVWLALALSEFVWMLYDIWVAIRAHLVGAHVGTGIEQMIRVAAIVFAFTATVAQRRAVPHSQ